MYRNILLPTDGSNYADQGVTNGLRLAKAIGAKTTALVVTEPFSARSIGLLETALLGATIQEINAEAKRAAEQRLRRVVDSATRMGVACEPVHVLDRISPAQGILDAVERHGCDLIVMASHGLHGIQRALLGSQAFDVVTRAQVPVLIVKAQMQTADDTGSGEVAVGAPQLYANILAATDGSPLAEKGVDEALALAKQVRASVTFVVASGIAAGLPVEGVPLPILARHPEIIQAMEEAADEILKRCAGKAAALGVVHELVNAHNGTAAEAILETASARRCDLIVMASHGYRGMKRLLLGSQAYQVVARSTLPVLVVR